MGMRGTGLESLRHPRLRCLLCLVLLFLRLYCVRSREAQLEAAVAALQRGLSAARREADGSVSTTKYMQARGHTLDRRPSMSSRCQLDMLHDWSGLMQCQTGP